jgi:hypothetical protein
VRILPALIALLAWALVFDAAAQTASSGPSLRKEIRDTEELLDNPPSGRTRTSFAERYLNFKRELNDKHGLLYAITPTVMLQQGTQGGKDDLTVNEQVHFMGRWEPRELIAGGSLNFLYMHLGQVTSTTGIDFLQSVGTSFALSDSPNDSDVLRALFWRQELFDDTLRLYGGQGEVARNDNSCKYACDDTDSFISAPLASNPTRTLPGAGTAAGIELLPSKSFEFAFAVQDARGDGKLNFTRVFDSGEIAYAGEALWRQQVEGLGVGEYRATAYHVDAIAATGQASSDGWQLAFEQDVGDVGLFLRGGGTSGRSSSVRRYIAGGAVWKGPSFGNKEDWFGVGGSWLRPSDSTRGDEGVVEMFYRLQLTPLVQLSPDVMLVFPSRGHNMDAVFIFRAQVLF